MKLLCFFFLSASVCFTSCLILPDTSSEPVPPSTPPDWVTQGLEAVYPATEYIAVEGQGTTLSQAERNALGALSIYFVSEVTSRAEVSQTISKTGTNQKYNIQLHDETFVKSSAKLFAVRYAASWRDKAENKYATVAYIKRNEAWAVYEPRIRHESDIFRALWRTAESETEPLRSFIAYKAAMNYADRNSLMSAIFFWRNT